MGFMVDTGADPAAPPELPGSVPPVFGAHGGWPQVSAAPSVPYPAGITAGQLLELYVGGNGAGGGFSVDTPSGWTLVGQDVESTVFAAVFVKIATGSESGNLATSFSGSFSGNCGGIISRYTGVGEYLGEAIEGAATKKHPNSFLSGGYHGTDVTTLGPGRLVVNRYASSNITATTPGSGWTERFDVVRNSFGLDYAVAGTDKDVAVTGQSGEEIATPGTDLAQPWVSVTYAIRSPAA